MFGGVLLGLFLSNILRLNQVEIPTHLEARDLLMKSFIDVENQLERKAKGLQKAIQQGLQPHQELQQQHDNQKLKINVQDFGAIGDNHTDNTAAFNAALQTLHQNGGGELLVPAGGVYQNISL